MRYSFPHYKGEPEFVQPDPALWGQVKIGMDSQEVIAILGEPLDDKLRGGRPKQVERSYYSYGWLYMPFMPHPRTYSFMIGFDEQAKVWLVQDPFGGDVSEDGFPTRPHVITPKARSIFSHFPRILDIRWRPPAGAYPMKFEIEVGHLAGDDRFFDEIIEQDLNSTFYCFSFCGAQSGRFRVRASNSYGVGDWSEYVDFEFTC